MLAVRVTDVSCTQRTKHKTQGGFARSRLRTVRSRIYVAIKATSTTKKSLQSFPQDYNEAIRQAQDAVTAALADDAKLVEIEFPTSGLVSVPGDGEGANEMTNSLKYLRQFCRMWQNKSAQVRIFLPDLEELRLAVAGQRVNPSAGAWSMDPLWEDSGYQLDYLTRPTGLLDLGLDINKVDVAARVQDTDALLLAAYPHFNVIEMLAVEELYRGVAERRGLPIVVFNGELDRIRSGYYPSFFYPKVGKLAKNFLPLFTQAYYIHNFKGSRPGVLFRCYPGAWQVMRRDLRDNTTVTVHTQHDMPSLKEVALHILPRH